MFWGICGKFGKKVEAKKKLEKNKETNKPFSSTVCIGSCGLRVARGGFGAKAPPLSARSVPRNGRGWRLVELTNGC